MDKKILSMYENASVPKSVAALVIPSVISQIISIIYNMADMFFVGKLNDPDQLAAVSLVAPAMLVLTALANLFGIGGASLMSRSLGKKDEQNAKRACTFSLYTALATALFLSLTAALFCQPILRLLGSNENTLIYTKNYFVWVFILGAVPSLMSMVLAHFVRSDGAAKLSGYVLSAGGILNLALDPVFIWGFGLGITGAAIAPSSPTCSHWRFCGVYNPQAQNVNCYRESQVLHLEEEHQHPSVGWRSAQYAADSSSLRSNAVLNNLANPTAV